MKMENKRNKGDEYAEAAISFGEERYNKGVASIL